MYFVHPTKYILYRQHSQQWYTTRSDIIYVLHTTVTTISRDLDTLYSTPGDNLILLQQLLQLCGRHLCLGDLSIIIAVLTRYIGESEIRAEQYIKLL